MLRIDTVELLLKQMPKNTTKGVRLKKVKITLFVGRWD